MPDVDDGTLQGDSVGKDILKAKIKIGKPKVKKSSSLTIDVSGIEAEGGGTSVNGGNQGSGEGHTSSGTESLPGSQPGSNPDVSSDLVVKTKKEPIQSGVVEGNGNRTISVKELSKRRLFPVQSDIGLYKAVIMPIKDYENLFIECMAVGEDGKKEKLSINKFMYQGKPIAFSKSKAGPIKIPKNIAAEFMITFNEKGKKRVNLILSEGGSI